MNRIIWQVIVDMQHEEIANIDGDYDIVEYMHIPDHCVIRFYTINDELPEMNDRAGIDYTCKTYNIGDFAGIYHIESWELRDIKNMLGTYGINS